MYDFLNTPTEKRTPTTQSSHILKLKDENKVKVKFDVIKRAAPFLPMSGAFNLGTEDNFEIMLNSQTASLNSRKDICVARNEKRKFVYVALMT